MLTICGHSTAKVEKNWTPLVFSSNNNGKGDILLLVYSLDPLVILSYDIDQGDGVCMLLYGDLPMKNMNEPYGGTPFKEIHFDDSDSNDGIKTRSHSYQLLTHGMLTMMMKLMLPIMDVSIDQCR